MPSRVSNVINQGWGKLRMLLGTMLILLAI
jgi:hypothetical protein